MGVENLVKAEYHEHRLVENKEHQFSTLSPIHITDQMTPPRE